MSTPWDDLTARLTTAADSILRSPEAAPAPPVMCALAGDLVADRAHPALADTLHPLIERFDGGALLQVLFLTNSEGAQVHLVALAGPTGILAAVATPDQGEADSLYAGLASALGLLSATCESYHAPIPAVYQYCADCT